MPTRILVKMEIDKQAKELLLCHSCKNCIYLDYNIEQPPLSKVDIQGRNEIYLPRTITIKLFCQFEKNIKDYENYVCEHWKERKSPFNILICAM